MTFAPQSSLTWLDTSENERRSTLELVAALNEPGTLDELGMGSVRDTFADSFFPGTSTIQTRARYFLFIPWILQMAERGPANRAEAEARRLQLQLCNALDRAHGANQGVIGRESGAALQRWPLSIYWQGLAQWGIRRYPGSTPSYFANLGRPSRWRLVGRALAEEVEGTRDEAADGIRSNWSNIPHPPPAFPDDATFALTAEEGHFLRERVVYTHPQSYLAHILQTSEASDQSAVRFPWDHPTAQTAPAAVRALLNDACLFSLVHRGAAILYNLMLADAMGSDQQTQDYSNELARWSQDIASAMPDLEHWDRHALWHRLRQGNPRLHPRTTAFADHWFTIAVANAGRPIGYLPEARRLIRERELALKGTRARLTYAEARDRRRGFPTSARLEFRWTQVQQITADILAGLEQG